MKNANTILSRTAFLIAFITAISLTILITNMLVNQLGDNVASATSQNKTIVTSDNQTTAAATQSK